MGWYGPKGKCQCCRCKCPGSNIKYKLLPGTPHIKVTIDDTHAFSSTFNRLFELFGFLGKGSDQDTTISGLDGIFGTYFFELGTDDHGCLDFTSNTPAILIPGSSYDVVGYSYDLLCDATVSSYSVPMQYRVEVAGNSAIGRYTVTLTWNPIAPSVLAQRRFNVSGAIALECQKHYDQTHTINATGISVNQTFSTLSGSFDGNAGLFYKLIANNEWNGCGPDLSTAGNAPEPAGSFTAELVWL